MARGSDIGLLWDGNKGGLVDDFERLSLVNSPWMKFVKSSAIMCQLFFCKIRHSVLRDLGFSSCSGFGQ